MPQHRSRHAEGDLAELARGLDAAACEIYLVDARTLEILHANPAARDALAAGPREGASPAKLTDLLPDDEAASLSAWTGDREAAGPPLVIRTRRRQGDDSDTEIRLRAERIPGAGPPRALVFIEPWEAGSGPAAEGARSAEVSFHTLFETAPDAIVICDEHGRMELVNRKAEDLFGYRRGELIGQPVEMLVPETVRDAHQGHRAHYLANPGVRPMAAGIELSGRRKDRSLFPAEISLSPLSSDNGRYIIAVVRDISDRVEAQRELSHKARALARSNAELEQFAYVASHDLQEPLRMVSSYVQLLARRYAGQLDDDADEFIEYAVAGAKRMQALINDLLSYSRVGSSGRSHARVALEDCLRQALENLSASIEQTGATVTHDPLPVVCADEVQLVQLFQNLIGNAIKFRDDEPPEVHVGVSEDDGQWTVSVADNGIGIAREHRERVFAVFQRLHAPSEYPGTGIGLAICKKIVERHGGHIWVKSASGAGTTFCFTLPEAPPLAE